MKTSAGKHLEDISHAHFGSLMYKLITSSKDSDDLSMSFDRSRKRRKVELAQNKNIKGKCHVRCMLRVIFSFAECQEKTTYGLGYKLALTRNKDDAVLDKGADITDARIKIGHIHCYVPHYMPSIQQQGILFKQILSETPTQLRYVEGSVFMKGVNNRNLRNFELGSRENMNVPIWINIRFQQLDIQDSQNLKNDTFCGLPDTSCQCIIGTEKYPDSSILLNYDDDDYSQSYSQIKEAFKA